MLEFKLKLYFEEYKDSDIISTTKFKERFIKKHGNFELLNELVIMIQKYQYKHYDTLIGSGKSTFKIVKKGDYNKNEQKRINARFGSKEERQLRKLKESYR